MDILPLYVKAGSIIPMGPIRQYATKKKEDPIELRVYTGADGEFTLYEDENDNYNYEKGVYSLIPFHWNEKTKILSIGKRKGEFPGMPDRRVFKIVFVHGNFGVGGTEVDTPSSEVVYNGESLKVRL